MGYKKIELPANKMVILANCFGTEGSSIQDMVAGGNVSLEGGDWIRMYDKDTGAYTIASWYGEGYGVYENAEASEPCADEGWGDGNQNIMEYPLAVGDAFWASSVEGGFIREAGTVASSGDITIPANQMVLVGNPFPVATDLQSIVASGNFSLEGGDWIRLYDIESGAYIIASWYGEGYGVYENAEASEPCADQGWADGNQNVINITIPAGHGFWCSSVGGGTLSFPNPIESK